MTRDGSKESAGTDAERRDSGRYGKWILDVSGDVETIEFATTIGKRMRGMLFRDPDEVTRVLVPCHDVHTFGMNYPLDIAFIDESGTVLEVHKNVGVRRRIRNSRAAMVAERFSKEGDWLNVGDTIRLGINKREQECEGA